MILHMKQLEELRPQLSGDIVATDGCFDLMHIGHIGRLRDASLCGDILIVGINTDEHMRKLKREPIISQGSRAITVDAIKGVDYVVMIDLEDRCKFPMVVRANTYIKEDGTERDDLIESIEESGANLVYSQRHYNTSTSDIINSIKGDYCNDSKSK